MSLVKINIKNIASETYPDDRVIFRSPTFREAPGGGITSTAETVVPLVDGIGEKELAPGPVIVRFQCRGITDTRAKRGTVPDEGTVDIAEVIAGTFEYTPAIVNIAREQITTARDEALGQVSGAVAAEVDGQLGTAVRNAETAAVTAEQAATSAESKVDSYIPRVVALEAVAGLSASSPVDGQTANLVANGDTQTHNAVAVVAADAVNPVSKNFAALVQRELPRNIPIPAEVGSAGGLEISYDGTTYSTNVDEIIEGRYRATGPTIFVDPVDGVDTVAADGLTPETAYRTPGYAATKNPGYAEMVITKSANFARSEATTPIHNGCTVRALPGTTVRFIIGDRATWTQNGSVWTASIATANGVIDAGALNLQGDPTMYKQMADVESVTNNPGSWYFSGGVVTIRTIDDRTPDDEVYVSRVIAGAGWSTTISTGTENISAYVEGIEYWGGSTSANLTARGTGWKFYAKNCGFHGASGNGLAAWGLELSVLVGCRASYNGLDGFNYTPSTNGGSGAFIEVDCIGSQNGVGGGSQNGSTSHNDYRGIRVAGLYTGNQGANVADVNNTMTLNVGCRESDSTDYKQGFYVNGTSRMWLDGCVATSENSVVNQDVVSKIYRRATMTIGKVIGEISDY